jgi:hypothetical protein
MDDRTTDVSTPNTRLANWKLKLAPEILYLVSNDSAITAGAIPLNGQAHNPIKNAIKAISVRSPAVAAEVIARK